MVDMIRAWFVPREVAPRRVLSEQEPEHFPMLRDMGTRTSVRPISLKVTVWS